MQTHSPTPFLTSFLFVLSLSACSGGSDNPITTPDVGAANGGSTPGETSTAVSGRVADGYIRGAVVCVDLNENQSCDANEPSAVTIEGGVYNLDVPSDASDKSIIADIPAEAIDEDTGETVGRALVFAAPAERPEFLSPMTTLVVEELRNNPALDLDSAEASLKTMLGVTDDDVSLFSDYVAGSSDTSITEEQAGDFKYLHDTARVVVSLMKDIDQRVEQAASDSGIDVSGDKNTQQAIRDIVRSEVKTLLPQIAAEVGSMIESSSEGSGIVLDPDLLARSISSDQDLDLESVDERIETIKAEAEVEKATMQALLTDGLYWIDVDCQSDERNESTDSAVGQYEDTAVAIDDYSHCSAWYGNVALSDAGDELVESEFYLDRESGIWVQEAEEHDDYPHTLILQNGQWVPETDDGPGGAVSFTDSGDAVLEKEFGRMLVTATVQKLDGSPIIHHLWKRGADKLFTRAVDGNQLFESDAQVSFLNISREVPPYLLSNWYGHDGGNCAEYGGNCNVLHQLGVEQYGTSEVNSLAQLMEGTAQGVRIDAYAYDEETGHPVTLELIANANGSNDHGVAKWQLSEPIYYPAGELVPAEEHPGDEYPAGEFSEVKQPDVEYPGDITETIDLHPTEYPDEQLPESDTHSKGTYQIDHLTGERVLVYPSTEQPETSDTALQDALDGTAGSAVEPLVSEWKVITVDGVRIMEITIPRRLRNAFDFDETDIFAMILIEQNGFVRRGWRQADTKVNTEYTYNQTAFDQVKDAITAVLSSNR